MYFFSLLFEGTACLKVVVGNCIVGGVPRGSFPATNQSLVDLVLKKIRIWIHLKNVDLDPVFDPIGLKIADQRNLKNQRPFGQCK